MSEKIATGLGVPFVDRALAAAAPGVADGYYYQLDLADPRTASGWTAGALLHDGSTATGHSTAAGGTQRSISLLVAKAASMTFDTVVLAPGYSSLMNAPVFYGSDDLTNWTLIVTGMVPALPGHVSFSYEPNTGYGMGSTLVFKYLAFTMTDQATSNAQAGCADIRVKLASVEVGP